MYKITILLILLSSLLNLIQRNILKLIDVTPARSDIFVGQ